MKPVVSSTVSIKPSRRLLLIQSVAHILAAASVLAATLPPWLTAVVLIAIGASLAFQRRQPVVKSLILHGDGRLEIVGADETTALQGGRAKNALLAVADDGTVVDVKIHPHTLVWSYLVVLLYEEEGRLRSSVILADSLEADEFRQIRLWLRWQSGAAILA